MRQRRLGALIAVGWLFIHGTLTPVVTRPAETVHGGSRTTTRQSYLAHTRTLPDWRVLSSVSPLPMACWHDLCLSLATAEISKETPSLDAVVGNHAAILRSEQVRTPSGPATLAFVMRAPPAAASFREPTYEDWLIVFREHPLGSDRRLAYAVRAVMTGSPEIARRELLHVAAGWRTPLPLNPLSE